MTYHGRKNILWYDDLIHSTVDIYRSLWPIFFPYFSSSFCLSVFRQMVTGSYHIVSVVYQSTDTVARGISPGLIINLMPGTFILVQGNVWRQQNDIFVLRISGQTDAWADCYLA